MLEAGWSRGGHGVNVRRLPPRNIAILRLRGFDDAVLAQIERQLSGPLPRSPNRATGQIPRMIWLAPAEWMIIDGPSDWKPLREAACGAVVAHVADIGEGEVSYEVSGERAVDLIAKGCTLDLHPRVFQVDCTAQSALAQTFVIIEKRAAKEPLFHLYADASYAHHLELWFEDAMVEFRLQDIS